jgi:hypothetical protein
MFIDYVCKPYIQLGILYLYIHMNVCVLAYRYVWIYSYNYMYIFLCINSRVYFNYFKGLLKIAINSTVGTYANACTAFQDSVEFGPGSYEGQCTMCIHVHISIIMSVGLTDVLISIYVYISIYILSIMY